MAGFTKVHKGTVAVYEKFARQWDNHRPRVLIEKSWLDKFAQSLMPGARLLDVGCGAGEPISRYLIEKGFNLTGVDASRSMVEICRSRFPQENWIVMDMRKLFLDRNFDGIIGWDSFFHLNPDEQRRTLKHFHQHLNPGGNLLLTVGHEAGEVLGVVEGEAVYHSSLSPEEYKDILKSVGFKYAEMVLEDKNCDFRSFLFAAN